MPLVLASFLVFGLLLAFTPCVLPMIPILSGIIAGEGAALSKSRALALSLSYVLGMALAYAVAGIAAAYSGLAARRGAAERLGAGRVRAGLRALALSMFGLYELQLPGFLHQRLDDAQQPRCPAGASPRVAGDGRALGGDRQPVRGGAARRRAALHRADARRGARRRGAVRHGARHGRAADRGRRLGRRAAAESRARGWNRVKQFFGVLLLAVAL